MNELSHCVAHRRVWLLFASALVLWASATAQVNVLTQHNDNARTGQNLSESALTPSNVNVTNFGLLFRRAVDDQIYTQPLYVANVTIGGGTHNVVYVETVNNTVYAFDADNAGVTTPYWQVNFGTAPTNVDGGWTNCVDISGKFGIMGTPVIDAASGTLYVDSISNVAGSWTHRLHALDLSTGAEKFGGPVAVTASGFTPIQQNQRPGLLLLNGVVYLAFGSHCDKGPYRAFIMGYNATTLAQVTVQNLSPGGNGAIWMAGQGPAADSGNNIYVITANGGWDGSTNFGESFVKFSTNAQGVLSIADWFTPNDWSTLNSNDDDLGAGGALVLPGTSDVIGGGKSGKLYLLNRSNLGHLTSGDSAALQVWQAVNIGSGTHHVHGSPAYWNSGTNGPMIYLWGENDFGRAFKFNGTTFTTTAFTTTTMAAPQIGSGMPGAMFSISANGNTNGIAWANCVYDGNANQQTRPGILRAFDANNLGTELWNSRMNAARDNSNNYAKYTYPTIANGKVYLSTFATGSTGTGELCVYGLLGGQQQVAAPSFSPGGGTYTSAQSVTITTTTSGASIRYTTDGSTPTSTTGTLYSAPVNISATTTLKAIAYLSGQIDSTVTSATYTISNGVLYEAESLTVGASSGQTWRTSTDVNGSGGAIAFYDATAAGNFVTLMVTVPSAATYDIRVGYKSGPNRGTFQFATAPTVGGTYTNVGGPQDEYNAAQIYHLEFDVGNYTFASSGSQAFRFTVTGKNAASSGFGLALDYIELIQQGGGSPPPAPTNLVATAGNAQVSLTWSASTGATSYNVKRSTTSGGPYSTISSPTATNFTDTTVTNGTTYYYVVTAVNGSGESGNSNQASATPTAGGAPPAPTGVTATAGDTVASISWAASSGATGYNVKRATTSGGPYTTIGSPAALSYTDISLTNGTTYYYVVTAVNASGESSNSTQVSAVPTLNNTNTYQAEALVIGASSGDTATATSDAGASAGQYVSYASNAAADFVTFTVDVPQARTYDVRVGVRRSSGAGIFQFASSSSVGGTYTDHGAAQDLYAASAAFAEVDIGPVVFGSAGTAKGFRLTVTGKNASSSGYALAIDYIKIIPQ